MTIIFERSKTVIAGSNRAWCIHVMSTC